LHVTGAAHVIRDYVLADTVRRLEDARGVLLASPDDDRRAVADGRDFAARVCARARLIAPSLGVDEAVQVAGGRLSFVAGGATVLAFVAGLGITGVFPDGWPARVNVFGLIATILVPHAVSLMIWVVTTFTGLIGPAEGRRPPWLGRRLVGAYVVLERLPGVSETERAAAAAWAAFLGGTAAGARRVAVVVHGIWLAGLVGTLVGLWWLLVVRQVDFVWGSTLLGDDRVAAILGTIAEAVAAFGFPVPEPGDVVRSRLGAGAEDPGRLRAVWGWFVLGAVVTLALVPRLVLTAIDAVRAGAARRHLTLDESLAGYARLAPRLMPVTHGRTIVSPDDSDLPVHRRSVPADGTAAALPRGATWLALEVPPAEAIPEAARGTDLGVVSTLDDERRVVDAIARGRDDVCIYADLRSGPDRGIARFLTELAHESSAPVHLVLGASRASAYLGAGDLAKRLEDWSTVAARAGLAGVHRLDGDTSA